MNCMSMCPAVVNRGYGKSRLPFENIHLLYYEKSDDPDGVLKVELTTEMVIEKTYLLVSSTTRTFTAVFQLLHTTVQ